MTDQERDAALSLCILAALADGRADDRERAALRQVAERLSAGSGVDLAARYEEILLGGRTAAQAAALLQSPEARQLAYEAAAGICLADGALVPAEERFLADLRAALGLAPGPDGGFAEQARALAAAPVAPAAPGPRPDAAALDKVILDAAILNGALELLPESLATMAIIPLQMRLVYRVGQAHGYELDRGHVTDLLATLGVGLTSQYVEQVGRKLVGGLLGALGGRLLGGLGRQAVSSGLAFATTYALGQVARRYYAGGRTLDAAALRETFQALLGEARALGQRHAPDIEARARTIDVRSIVDSVRRG